VLTTQGGSNGLGEKKEAHAVRAGAYRCVGPKRKKTPMPRGVIRGWEKLPARGELGNPGKRRTV